MLATELGGQTLTPGVYNSHPATFGITGTLTLERTGQPGRRLHLQEATR